MTLKENIKHAQDLALAVYAAHEALEKIEKIARKEGLDCRNKQSIYFHYDVRGKGNALQVLRNGEVV